MFFKGAPTTPVIVSPSTGQHRYNYHLKWSAASHFPMLQHRVIYWPAVNANGGGKNGNGSSVYSSVRLIIEKSMRRNFVGRERVLKGWRTGQAYRTGTGNCPVRFSVPDSYTVLGTVFD